ncbi:hemagglutinin repeat-containing protein [Oryzomicrobium sp.]|uniref:hemagglutinin repeat-containing protein n=1 Tax=Oryzomicrobium sp. TaxID=1911578 RepID=UPI0025F6FCC7|nr:hemagglutinin repeat-containing protein [Oryzomicrobium sp.]MCE1244338.1 hemagglutinin repeat-containing protein [Oryzomicrobium sp.]
MALTEALIAQLTSDIVWLVEKDVTLPDGTHTRALVPQVYVRVQPGDIDGNGALLAGSNVDLNIGSKFTNSGTIAGRNVVSLTADTINNLGGRIAGNNVALTARTDLNNLGGLLQGGDSLMLSAGRDINVASTTHTSQSGQGDRTNVDRVAGLYVSNPKAVLLASAGRDVNLLGAQIVNEGAGGTTAIAATNNLNLGTVGESYRQDLIFDSRNTRKESSRQEVGTIIQTSGDIQLLAGQDITARAAQVASDKGAMLASAGRDVAITAGEAGYSLDSSSYSKSTGSWGSKKTVTTRDSVKDTTAIASSFSGDTVFIQAGQDITVKGSNVAAVNAATLIAGRDLALETATETHAESHFREEKNSGLSFSVTDGLSYGKSAQNQNLNGQGSTQVGSTLSGANVSTASGRDTRIVASNVLADQNIDIAAGRNIDILAAANTNTTKSEAHSSSASLGLATGLSANFTILSLGSGAENGKGTVVTQSTSLLSANGGSLTLNAGLDSQYQGMGQGNITTQGADLIAKDKITLSGNAIDLQAIANTTAARSHSESKNFTVGARPAGVVGSLISQISDRVTAVSKGTGNSRLDNAMALKAGYDTYKLFNAGEAASAAAQTGADAVQSAGSGASFGVSVTIGSSSSQSNSQSASSQVLGTNLQGKDIALTARETDIHLQAAKLQAENVSLDAARDVLLEAGANTSSLHTDNSSSSASVGVTIGIGQQSGISIQLGIQNAKGKANGSETVYDNTLITATDTLKIKSGNDTTLKGAQLAANHVTLDVGRNLTIETLQDRSQYESEQTSGGFGVSLCIPPFCYGTSSASVNASDQSIKHNYQSAVGQSGIAAGDGGFDIKVGQQTDLVGAAITSTADAAKNHLTTGSLTSRDLTNTQHTEGSSSSIALTGSFGIGNQPDLKVASAFTQGANNIAPNVLGNKALNEGMPKSGSEQSQTQSVISPAQIQITGSGDAARDAQSQATADTLTQRDPKTANQALTNTLTLQQVAELEKALKTARQNDEAARLLAQTGQELANTIGTVAGKKFDELNKEAMAARIAGQTEKADALAAEAAKWDEGGAYRVGLHALAGALTGGGIEGALGAGAVAKAAPLLNDLQGSITKTLKDGGASDALANFVGQLVSGGAAAGVGALASGGNVAGASTGLNVDVNNRQLHLSEAQLIKRLAKGDPKKEARLTAAACAMVRCADGIPITDPSYGYLKSLQDAGGMMFAEQVILNGQRGVAGEVLFEYSKWDKAGDLWSQNKMGSRFVGAGQGLFGVLGVAGSTAICTTGLGCAAGLVTGTISADYAQAGIKQAWTGDAATTYGEQVLKSFGLSPEAAAYTYAALGVLPSGLPALGQMFAKVAPQIDALALNAGAKLGQNVDDFASSLAAQSTRTAGNGNRVVLGKWEGNYSGYVGDAKLNGGVWYQTDPGVWEKMTVGLTQQESQALAWKVNEAFLKQQLQSGVRSIEFVGATPEAVILTRPDSFSAREVLFLTENAGKFGYVRTASGWIKK